MQQQTQDVPFWTLVGPNGCGKSTLLKANTGCTDALRIVRFAFPTILCCIQIASLEEDKNAFRMTQSKELATLHEAENISCVEISKHRMYRFLRIVRFAFLADSFGRLLEPMVLFCIQIASLEEDKKAFGTRQHCLKQRRFRVDREKLAKATNGYDKVNDLISKFGKPIAQEESSEKYLVAQEEVLLAQLRPIQNKLNAVLQKITNTQSSKESNEKQKEISFTVIPISSLALANLDKENSKLHSKSNLLNFSTAFSKSKLVNKQTQDGTSPKVPGPLEKCFNLQDRDVLDARIAGIFFSSRLPFHLARNPYYREAFFLCVTIFSDEWSDPQRIPLINFMFVTESGSIFLMVVGSSNAVQIVTNNIIACKAIGMIIENEFYVIYWTPCVVNDGDKSKRQKVLSSQDVTSLKELGRMMGPLQRQAFRKVYGKILDLTAAEVFTEAVVSLAQYYDQPLRCFTFGDFQMVPTIEEFEEILGCPLGGRKPYLVSGFLPSLSKIAAVVGDSEKELDCMKQTRNSVVGLPRKYLEGKARDMASQEKWGPFADILALLIFGVVLFPNVDGLVDLATIDAFLTYHHSKESPVVAILADLFNTFDRRCEKNNARIVCCLPTLCVWLISHLFQQDTRHPCPLQSYRSCAEKGRVDWDQHLAGIGGSAINWFPRWKEGKEGVLFSCGDYPNVPLIGTWGCINYNPALAIRQLGYPMRGAPTEGSLSPFLVKDLGAQGLKVIQRIHKAWRSPLRKDKELRGIRNGVIGGYHGWLRIHTRGLDWLSKLKVIDEENFEAPEEDEEVRALKLELGKARLAKEKFKSAATHIRKECTELQEENVYDFEISNGENVQNLVVNMILKFHDDPTVNETLEQETKRARKEEYGREKFRGALWGSNNELKLRREERDRSRVHDMILKEELVAYARSKRSLAQHLEATEQSMLAIIGQYKEELNQSVAHEQKLVEDFAQVYAEKEARGRVIDALHQEATMWMDRFALTLNGNQDLPRLLAKEKAMAEVCTAPEEIHGLINYCQHMIDLMAHIIRNQGVQEQMKVDLSALKDQMTSISEVMLKLQKTIEDKATATASSTVREAEPVLQPTLNPGRDRNTTVFGRRYSPQAYPYGLPPDFTPRATPEDLSQAPTFEGQLPPYDDYPGQDDEEGDTHLGPLLHLKDLSPHELPQPNIVRHIPASPTPVKEYVPFAEDKGKIEALEERIEFGLRKGKFEYAANMAPNNNRRAPVGGARKKEGDAHAVTTAPTWMKAPQNIQSSYQPNPPNFLIRARNSLPTQVKGPPAVERALAQRTAPAAPQLVNNTAPNATYKYAQHPPPKDNFLPIPMAYSELWPSLLENHLVVAVPGKVLQPPYTKWYDPGAKCAYHSGVPRHNIDSCLPFKYKVRHLISVGWLSFQEEGPNVRTNPLASHGGASVNAVEEDGPSRAKRLGETLHLSITASGMHGLPWRRQKGRMFVSPRGVARHGNLSRGRRIASAAHGLGAVEVSIGGREEPQICMQSEEKRVPLTPKALPGMGLGKDCLGNADMVDIKGNPYKYGLGYEPGMPGRRNVPSRFLADRVWPGRISQCFTSAGMVSKEEVAAIEEEFPQDPPSFVQPCHPDSQVGNWRVISVSA
ncbi:hypothetical protein HKD37_02G004082 [Glycine soja]